MPTLSSGTWEIEFQKPSTVWPVTPRLLPGWMKVTDAINGKVNLSIFEKLGDGKEGRFGIQGIENGLDQQNIGAAVD